MELLHNENVHTHALIQVRSILIFVVVHKKQNITRKIKNDMEHDLHNYL